MKLTRREALVLLGSAAGLRGAERMTPQLCLFSGAVAKLEYSDLGAIVQQFGFDGIDLTVRPGGHVEPRLSNVDLVRAIEEVRGAGLDVPVITTALSAPRDSTALPVIAIAGRTKVPLFRAGFWKVDLGTARREAAGLTSLGRHYGMAVALHNYSGENAGEAPWGVDELLEGLDPQWAGISFDPIHAGAGWETALRSALTRLKLVMLKDFTLRDGEAPQPCALGKGVVDWPKFFGILSGGHFVGPVSLHLEYQPKDELGAIARDAETARKFLNGAYVRMGSGSGAGSGSGPGWGVGTGSGGYAYSNR
jgi:sugar phosphate isomerase/epimerase